ncbi:hypothetical protein S245_067545, partial [Arachis hypogaea]
AMLERPNEGWNFFSLLLGLSGQLNYVSCYHYSADPTYVVAPVLQSRSGRQDLKKLFEFINEPDGEENLPSELASAVPQTITVTPEENEAIQR